MSFLSKLKQTFNVGGVHVEMRAPSHANFQDAAVPVSLSFTTKSPQTVKSITLKLVGYTQATQPTTASPRVFAQTTNGDAFAIQPGENKQIDLSLPLNIGAAAANMLPDDNILKGMAGALKNIENTASALDPKVYSYYLEAVADVEGATFDPSARQQITLFKPGELGTSLNVNL
ncbi:MAG TPA: hypothetical protein VL737_00820 [Candidatus Pristimantibacillus sp.]|jgi:hypothetical protein|nr:hypothetical protein [Candidatus Pristimantibacillus sp.]